ncbi:MAG: homoserine dehydrogenase [Clostridia bacterium]|nr:homoserine dehydrogenase [Clostridia bacterium]
MKHIAIIGFGIVGGGIPDVIDSCRDGIINALGEEVNVKYILDLRDFPDSPLGDRVVHDINVIVEDPEIELVCETMGGSHPAYEFSVTCMEHGISVVTSNKEVVANFGDKLLECAKKNAVSYLFEASVGGGIPCLRPFATSLGHEKITGVSGILNGTTNFILTKMKTEGREFADVLAEAQALGYAERDPSADVDGIDAMRKIIILTALATGKLASDKVVYAETIRNITPADIDAAERIGGAVKLIGTYKAVGDKMSVFVCPQIVKNDMALSAVNDVYNAVSVKCDITGDVMFYGRGAGRYPTAGAVVADAVAVLSGAAEVEKNHVFVRDDSAVLPFEDVKFTYYIRTAVSSAAEAVETFKGVFDDVTVLDGSADGVCEFICGKLSKRELDATLPALGDVQSVIRILE